MDYQSKTREELIQDLLELHQKYNTTIASYETEITEFKQEIADRKKNEQELIKNEALTRMALENFPIIFFMIDSEGIFKLSMGAGLKGLGLESNQVVGLSVFEIYKDHPEITDAINKALSGQTATFESNVNNASFWNIVSPFLLSDKQEGIVGVALEITERKKAENSLKEIDAQLKNAMAVAKLGAWSFDVATGLFTFNDQFYNLLGTTLEQEGGYTMTPEKYATRFFFPEDIQLVVSETQKALETTDPNFFSKLDHRLIDVHGNIKYVSVHIRVVKDAQGKTIQTYGVNQDITDRKLSELIIKDERERLSTILNTVEDPIFVKNNDHQIILANKAFYDIFNTDEKNTIGYTLAENVPDNEREQFLAVDRKVLDTGISDIRDETLTVDGFTRTIITRKSRFIGHSGEKFLVGSIHDITDRKQYEINLIKAKEKAEENDRLKTAFLQNMSHEIRTPMNAIMGFSELLNRNFDNKSKLSHYTTIINQRCKDLLVIINDILDISKIESGQLPVSIESFNINSLFTELKVFFAEYQQKIDKQNITFLLHAQCDPVQLIIATDKVKLKQILINLISNAFKFTNQGQIEGGCRFEDSKNIVFYVSDTGIGIPAEKQELIFERFVQIESASTRFYGGTGLGLSIVKGLVNLLGGKIWLESAPGVGSTFYFSLPYNNLQEEIIEQPDTNTEYEKKEYPNKTLLVVEDDSFNVDYLKELLSEIQVHAIYVQYGKEAINAALTENIDLVLMDISLPDISGYEVVRQILQHKPDLKIIAQTAYAAQEDIRKAYDAGCVDYIGKPINSDTLFSIINKHLS